MKKQTGVSGWHVGLDDRPYNGMAGYAMIVGRCYEKTEKPSVHEILIEMILHVQLGQMSKRDKLLIFT